MIRMYAFIINPSLYRNLTANDLDYLPAGIFSTVDSRVM